MRILVSGSHGLIGTALTESLVSQGHAVGKLTRPGAGFISPGDVAWNPGAELPPDALKDVDAVVHLAGHTVAGRWSERMKREIRESRVPATAALARSIAASFKQYGKPAVMVSASAIGYYGSRGDEVLREDSAPGHGFLAEVCREWEAATSAASDAGVRVAIPRIGLVLSERGGAMAKMLPIFRLGLAGRIASGRQWWSWISLEDLVAAIGFALTNPNARGPFNATSPSSVTNAEFTRTLAKVLYRPAIFPLPAAIARIALGSGADEMVLSSARVAPEKLSNLGFQFRDQDLKSTLQKITDRRY